jgi:hypothetical protein
MTSSLWSEMFLVEWSCTGMIVVTMSEAFSLPD